jgi:hypothetical protein
MNIIYFIINIQLISCMFISQDCTKHTKIYKERGGLNNFYFNSETFSKSGDICKEHKTYYKKSLIEKNIECSGEWCNNLGINNWGCKETNKDGCYHVENIISKSNFIKDIDNCETSIVGNYIMSYGKWNKQLGNGFYDEKRNVYGSDIFYKAYDNIFFCCHKKNKVGDYPLEINYNKVDRKNSNLNFLLIGFINGMVFISCLFFVLKYEEKISQINKQEESLVEFDDNIV